MPEAIASTRRASRPVLIWAVTATAAAFLFGNASLLLLVKLRESKARIAQGTAQKQKPAAFSPSKARATTPFATLQDSDVAGRYHLFQEGTNVGIITLLPNHSIINKDGDTYPQYHWEVQPGGLMTRWLAGRLFFDVMVKPGVYVLHSKDGREYRRLEKVEE